MSTDEELEIVRGSGNVFRDLGDPNPDLEQAKAILGAHIIKLLDENGFSTRKAASLTGYQQADFSRIRNAELNRFTLDKLVKVVNALDQEHEVFIDFRPRGSAVSGGHQPHAV